jgi:hypothetical protein
MQPDIFEARTPWDRVYISTLFTYYWSKTIETIEFYKRAVAGNLGKLYVGGVLASLLPEDLYAESGVYPIVGRLHSPAKIRLDGDENIDQLPPDYTVLDEYLYAINETFYTRTTRGCVNHCAWCGVPIIEDGYTDYIDIRPEVESLRASYGDLPILKLMDDNIIASAKLAKIVEDLVELGYGRGAKTSSDKPRARVVDFNQGLDATFLNDEKMRLLSRINIAPMRIAFDRLEEKEEYVRAIRLAYSYGVKEFSNYMLYYCDDTPRDLYERLRINIDLNREFRVSCANGPTASIYSYPMKYAPIRDDAHGNPKSREPIAQPETSKGSYIDNAQWNRKFARNIGIMRGVAYGAISSTPSLALRTIGEDYETYIANLYMPEELLRYRNKYEARVYRDEPSRAPGTGAIEEFREFLLRLLLKGGREARDFHNAVSHNRAAAIRRYAQKCKDKEILRWLELYLKKG